MPNYSNTDYDIGKAFEAIENELMESMIRNLKHHKVEEANEDKQWTMWQSEQLKSLEKYKKANQAKYQKQFKQINKQVDALLRIAHQEGGMEQEIAILEAIKKGFLGAKKLAAGSTAKFFRLNERKLEALIKATTDDLKKAETAVLRMANDQYRQIIYNAQVYANTGAGTYEKAVDMASKDFLSRGINCIEYKNGARHTIGDYAEMAIRTASKRAYLQGEGAKRQEWGISTVILNKRGNPCPKCLPFCGKVFIDDVWSGGKKEDGNYPLLSKAIAKGLYHPRCKDSHTTYFPGISEPPNGTYTKEELELIEKENQAAVQEQYAKRQAERFERLAMYSLAPENQERYAAKREGWEKTLEISSGYDIIKTENEKDNRRLINLIEQRNNSKGKPGAIFRFGGDLNKRQERLLKSLQEYDSSVVVDKREVSMYDLSALTAKTNVEYAMFTKGKNRLIIRGDEASVNVTVQRAKKLFDEGYRWSGHTHPGVDEFVLMPSDGDKAILEIFQQEFSVIYNSNGRYYVFERE